MWRGVVWVCSLVGFACDYVPNVAIIQTAYDREAAAGSALHDKELQVIAAKCHDNSSDRFLCEVTFIRTRASACISTSLPSPAIRTAGSSRAACASDERALIRLRAVGFLASSGSAP
jgi:hypothetical protein